MQTAEIVIYFLIAVIIGGLGLGTIKAMDYINYQKTLREQLKTKDQVFNVDKIQFADELAKRWKECGYGSINRTFSLYIRDNGTLDKGFVIDRLNMINYCEDDLIDCLQRYGKFQIFNTTQIPVLVSVKCYNHTLIVDAID